MDNYKITYTNRRVEETYITENIDKASEQVESILNSDDMTLIGVDVIKAISISDKDIRCRMIREMIKSLHRQLKFANLSGATINSMFDNIETQYLEWVTEDAAALYNVNSEGLPRLGYDNSKISLVFGEHPKNYDGVVEWTGTRK